MLNWTKAAGKPPLFGANVETDDGAAIQSACADFWRKILAEIDERQGDQSWDLIICQIWPDTGRIIAHPATHRDYEWAQSMVMVQMAISSWQAAYDALPDPDIQQGKFNRAYKQLYKSIVSALKLAAGETDLRTRFAKLKKHPLFGVFVVNAPESIQRERLEILLGNRLPKIDYKTDRELFDALFRKAGHPYGIKHLTDFKDGKIVRVTFFGRDFKDTVLSILDLVPDLVGMCPALREIRIHATAISAKRIYRLRQQLPTVNVRVLSEKEYWDEWKREHDIKDDNP